MSHCFFRLAGYFVAAALFIVLLTTAPDHFAERPELIISEETTVFLGPIRDDGTINYVAAWNAKFSEGVTPENNANTSDRACDVIGPYYSVSSSPVSE